MRDKTRNLIRRSEEKDTVIASNDPDEFLQYYDFNCRGRDRVNRYEQQRTRKLMLACIERDQGKVLLSKDGKTGKVNAGIFVVWDATTMYYLMSTRSVESADNGAISLLLWNAMNESHRRTLKFDFDGVSSPGTFRFLSGFGGDVARRLVVEKVNLAYHAMDKMHALIHSNGNLRRPFS
jgi:lipid II:glycine glycyltransferase (peptidoglycan interpeptide bridge formation enzyme)